MDLAAAKMIGAGLAAIGLVRCRRRHRQRVLDHDRHGRPQPIDPGAGRGRSHSSASRWSRRSACSRCWSRSSCCSAERAVARPPGPRPVPQIDPSTFATQIFWLIVAFVTLYWLLSRRALPRLTEVLEARQDRIAADLDEAERLRREAEAALTSYQAAIAKAQDEAHALLAETQGAASGRGGPAPGRAGGAAGRAAERRRGAHRRGQG